MWLVLSLHQASDIFANKFEKLFKTALVSCNTLVDDSQSSTSVCDVWKKTAYAHLLSQRTHLLVKDAYQTESDG